MKDNTKEFTQKEATNNDKKIETTEQDYES